MCTLSLSFFLFLSHSYTHTHTQVNVSFRLYTGSGPIHIVGQVTECKLASPQLLHIAFIIILYVYNVNVLCTGTHLHHFLSVALGPLVDSDSDLSDNEAEISNNEVKALKAEASKVAIYSGLMMY